jgi:large conductance mechanosensitive channel
MCKRRVNPSPPFSGLSVLSDFKAFLLKQNILALAIAVVVGSALNLLVKALVDDFIMPIVAAILPGGDWQKAVWHVGPVAFAVGDFVSALVNFIIVALVAWRIARAFLEADAAKPPTKVCQFCRMEIDAGAVKCPHCTSPLAALTP